MSESEILDYLSKHHSPLLKEAKDAIEKERKESRKRKREEEQALEALPHWKQLVHFLTSKPSLNFDKFTVYKCDDDQEIWDIDKIKLYESWSNALKSGEKEMPDTWPWDNTDVKSMPQSLLILFPSPIQETTLKIELRQYHRMGHTDDTQVRDMWFIHKKSKMTVPEKHYDEWLDLLEIDIDEEELSYIDGDHETHIYSKVMFVSEQLLVFNSDDLGKFLEACGLES